MINTENHFLDHPEVNKYFANVFNIINTESDRGAILIAASQVDNFLEQALKEIAPKGISKNKLTNMFDYTGPLGTFSSRINMAFFLRIINNDVVQAINTLRVLRNDAAHYPTSFSLLDNSDRIDSLYKIGKGVPETLHSCAINGILNSTIDHALSIEIDSKLVFNNIHEVVKYIQDNPEIKKSMEEKLPKWKLGLSIALLCGLIFYGSNEIRNIFENGTKVW